MTDLVLVTAAVGVVVMIVSWCVSRARRLDRLHVRLDAARFGLVAALGRRAAVAARVAAVPPADPALASAAAAATDARPSSCELAENTLTRRLAALDRGRLDDHLFAELVDAEQLVVLARRVHNDAVRDTLALRSRRLVRWLRLAGTAPEPVYFDIAEPEAEPDRPRVPRSPGSRDAPTGSS